jgi:hypothetical protein
MVGVGVGVVLIALFVLLDMQSGVGVYMHSQIKQPFLSTPVTSAE